jgi:putative spermidine/putrescine transport system substrate-binding protein
MKRLRSSISRREILKAGSGLVLATFASPAIVSPASAQSANRLTMVSYGGSYGDFIRDGWNKPFTAETGIEVILAEGPDLAKAKAMVQTKNIEWDIFDSAGSIVIAGSRQGLWEPLDGKVTDGSRYVVPVSKDYVPVYIYSGGIAWDPARVKAPAQDFAQLWNTKSYPGRRGLRKRASETMELALIADGVDPDKVYPLDVDRVFKSLDRIKGSVRTWFDQTAQGITLIQTGECEYTYTFANRVKAAKEAGISIDFSFKQNLNALNYFAVLRGTPRKEAAMRYLEFVTRPAQQARMAEKISLVPIAKNADTMTSESAKKWQPDLKSTKNLFISDDYWADNFVKLDRRFREWLLT